MKESFSPTKNHYLILGISIFEIICVYLRLSLLISYCILLSTRRSLRETEFIELFLILHFSHPLRPSRLCGFYNIHRRGTECSEFFLLFSFLPLCVLRAFAVFKYSPPRHRVRRGFFDSSLFFPSASFAPLRFLNIHRRGTECAEVFLTLLFSYPLHPSRLCGF